MFRINAGQLRARHLTQKIHAPRDAQLGWHGSQFLFVVRVHSATGQRERQFFKASFFGEQRKRRDGGMDAFLRNHLADVEQSAHRPAFTGRSGKLCRFNAPVCDDGIFLRDANAAGLRDAPQKFTGKMTRPVFKNRFAPNQKCF